MPREGGPRTGRRSIAAPAHVKSNQRHVGTSDDQIFRYHVIKRDLARRLEEGAKFAFCHTDPDHFKELNDRQGNDQGDGVILLVSKNLRGYGFGPWCRENSSGTLSTTTSSLMNSSSSSTS